MTIRVTADLALVAEVDLRFGNSGKAYARFRAVSNERKRDASGKWVDGDPTWVTVTCFGKTAEMLAESNPSKGTRLLVEGTLQTRKWTGKDGEERDSLEITAYEVGLALTFTAYQRMDREQVARSAARKADWVDEGPVSESPF